MSIENLNEVGARAAQQVNALRVRADLPTLEEIEKNIERMERARKTALVRENMISSALYDRTEELTAKYDPLVRAADGDEKRKHEVLDAYNTERKKIDDQYLPDLDFNARAVEMAREAVCDLQDTRLEVNLDIYYRTAYMFDVCRAKSQTLMQAMWDFIDACDELGVTRFRYEHDHDQIHRFEVVPVSEDCPVLFYDDKTYDLFLGGTAYPQMQPLGNAEGDNSCMKLFLEMCLEQSVHKKKKRRTDEV
jgi:hypothetical protein